MIEKETSFGDLSFYTVSLPKDVAFQNSEPTKDRTSVSGPLIASEVCRGGIVGTGNLDPNSRSRGKVCRRQGTHSVGPSTRGSEQCVTYSRAAMVRKTARDVEGLRITS